MNQWETKRRILARYGASSSTYLELYREEQKRKYDLALSMVDVGSGELVLDLGCGPGLFLELLPKDAKGVGLDYSRTMVRRGERVASYVLADVDFLPIRADCVDKAFSFTVFQNLPGIGHAFEEAGRVLKPEGKFCLSLLNTAGRDGEVRRIAASAGLQLKDEQDVQGTRDRVFVFQRSL